MARVRRPPGPSSSLWSTCHGGEAVVVVVVVVVVVDIQRMGVLVFSW